MTISIATSGPRAAAGEVAEYRPGVCNIGPAEIARRRRAGHVGVVLSVAAFIVLVASGVPPLARLLVALPAAIAATGYLQARLKFCVGFAALGVLNFGELGERERIEDPGALARDRARARWITLAATVIGIAVGAIAVLLPI